MSKSAGSQPLAMVPLRPEQETLVQECYMVEIQNESQEDGLEDLDYEFDEKSRTSRKAVRWCLVIQRSGHSR